MGRAKRLRKEKQKRRKRITKTATVKLLPNGNMLIRRGSVEENNALLDFIQDMITSKSIGDLKRFFKSAEETRVIFGEEVFCG